MDVKTVRDEMRMLRYNTYPPKSKEARGFMEDLDKLLDKWISLLDNQTH